MAEDWWDAKHKQGRAPQMQMMFSGWSVSLCEAVSPGVFAEEWLSAPEEIAKEVAGTDKEAPED